MSGVECWLLGPSHTVLRCVPWRIGALGSLAPSHTASWNSDCRFVIDSPTASRPKENVDAPLETPFYSKCGLLRKDYSAVVHWEEGIMLMFSSWLGFGLVSAASHLWMSLRRLWI
eukprot:3573728-Amphidinium_carterae.1